MKLQKLKSRLITEGAIAVGIAAALLTILLVLMGVQSSSEQSKLEKKASLDSINQRLQQTKDDMERALKSEELYKKLFSNAAKKEFVNPIKVTELFDGLKSKHLFSELRAEISQVQPATAAGLANSYASTYYVTVKMTFKALNDESVFAFIGDVTAGLPGVVSVKNIKLKKVKTFENTDAELLRQAKLPALVEGDLSLIWATIAPTELPPPAAGGS